MLYANAAAETFFSLSQGVLKRQTLPDIIAFSQPARRRWSARSGAPAPPSTNTASTSACRAAALQKLVDVFAGAMPDHAGLIVLMLQQRSMAQMIERQLTHRAAARSVSGLAAVLAHEIKNPLSGIRGAAQLLEPGL